MNGTARVSATIAGRDWRVRVCVSPPDGFGVAIHEMIGWPSDEQLSYWLPQGGDYEIVGVSKGGERAEIQRGRLYAAGRPRKAVYTHDSFGVPAPVTAYGAVCKRCKLTNEYAEANAYYVCFNCR